MGVSESQQVEDQGGLATTAESQRLVVEVEVVVVVR